MVRKEGDYDVGEGEGRAGDGKFLVEEGMKGSVGSGE